MNCEMLYNLSVNILIKINFKKFSVSRIIFMTLKQSGNNYTADYIRVRSEREPLRGVTITSEKWTD